MSKVRSFIDTLKQRLEKYQPLQVKFRAFTGDGAGNVDVPNRDGYIFVRDWDGNILQAFNPSITSENDRYVEVGIVAPDPRLRMLSLVKSHEQSSEVPVPPHDHSWNSRLTTWVHDEQILSWKVTPNATAAFSIDIYPGLDYVNGSWIFSPLTTVDLSAHVPATGALFVLVSIDNTGAFSIVDGTAVDTPEIMTGADIPTPVTNKVPKAIVRLFAGQEMIRQEPTYKDIFDPRWALGLGGGAGYTPPATTAADDFQVGDGAGNWVKKTLAQVKTILGLGSFAYISSLAYSALTGLPTLDTVTAPAANVSMNSHKITNLSDGVGAQDAAAFHQIAATALSAFAVPTSDISMNSHKITNLANGVSASDAMAFGQYDFLFPMATYVNLNPLNSSSFPYAGTIEASLKFIKWTMSFFTGGTAHDSTNYYTFTLLLRQSTPAADVYVATLDTKTLASLSQLTISTTTFSPSSVTGTGYLAIMATKVGSPSDVYAIAPALRCKLT